MRNKQIATRLDTLTDDWLSFSNQSETPLPIGYKQFAYKSGVGNIFHMNFSLTFLSLLIPCFAEAESLFTFYLHYPAVYENAQICADYSKRADVFVWSENSTAEYAQLPDFDWATIVGSDLGTKNGLQFSGFSSTYPQSPWDTNLMFSLPKNGPNLYPFINGQQVNVFTDWVSILNDTQPCSSLYLIQTGCIPKYLIPLNMYYDWWTYVVSFTVNTTMQSC